MSENLCATCKDKCCHDFYIAPQNSFDPPYETVARIQSHYPFIKLTGRSKLVPTTDGEENVRVPTLSCTEFDLSLGICRRHDLPRPWFCLSAGHDYPASADCPMHRLLQ